uniref:Uncharacterized protein n=1 Tax=Arundo donax TaxID=35708 RepID=A0A0A9CJX9_ARUDO
MMAPSNCVSRHLVCCQCPCIDSLTTQS